MIQRNPALKVKLRKRERKGREGERRKRNNAVEVREGKNVPGGGIFGICQNYRMFELDLGGEMDLDTWKWSKAFRGREQYEQSPTGRYERYKS